MQNNSAWLQEKRRSYHRQRLSLHSGDSAARYRAEDLISGHSDDGGGSDRL